jgi:hypothetical protein
MKLNSATKLTMSGTHVADRDSERNFTHKSLSHDLSQWLPNKTTLPLYKIIIFKLSFGIENSQLVLKAPSLELW